MVTPRPQRPTAHRTGTHFPPSTITRKFGHGTHFLRRHPAHPLPLLPPRLRPTRPHRPTRTRPHRHDRRTHLGPHEPSAFGFAVNKDLQHSRDHDSAAGAGPIISHIRSGRWSFLIRPDLPDDTALFAEMFRLDIFVVRTGATIALPSPTDRGELFRRWIQPPRCPFRPSGRLVIDSVRACAARSGWLRTPTGHT